MKKIYSFAFAAAALFAAACQTEMIEPVVEGEGFAVTATTEADTKTVLNEAAIWWSPKDMIAVFDAENKEVAFQTNITESSKTATFWCYTGFTAPESLVAAYPWRGAYEFDGTVLKNFRIAGTQTAVAGSFDPAYAGAIGFAKEAGSTKLSFRNVHSLVKFTVGGETAPTTVKLANNGMRMIAGLYHYNIETGAIEQGDGAGAVTLSGTFEVGKTYYIAVIPGVMGNGVTLSFDGTAVKNTGETVTFEQNTIYDLGTVALPQSEEPEVDALNVTRVWGKYSLDGTSWWTGGPESLDDRNMTMDDEYVYVANTTSAPAVHKFKIADGTYAGKLDVTGMTTGTHPVSVLKMVKNTDAAINGGKDILVACNLTTDGAALQIWAWENGTAAAPVQKYSLAAARRFGDKMNFSGTWQSGKFWFRSNQAGDALVANIPVTNGAVQTWIDAYRMTLEDYQCMSDVFWYPQENGTVADYCLIGTNSSTALYLMSGTSTAGAGAVHAQYANLKNTLGVNFFEYNSKKYIAWVSMADGGSKPKLQIVEADGSSLATLKADLDKYPANVAYEAPVQHATDFTVAGPSTGVNADCAVRTINGEVYVAAMCWKTGLSVFKLN